jgi:MFS family permease
MNAYVWVEYNVLHDHISYIYKWEEEHKTLFFSILTSMIQLGDMFSAPIAGNCADKYGRRFCLMAFSIILIIGTILTLIENTPILIIGRFI